MDKRCYDLLDIPNLIGLELVAGKEGLDNSIYWPHVAEASPDIESLFTWLKPDDFLIITGNFLKDNSNALYEITTNAINTKLSGILIYKNPYCDYPPNYMIDLANKHNLPVFFLPNYNIPPIELSYYISHMVMHNLEYSDYLEKLFKDVYYTNYEIPEMKICRAKHFGYRLNRPHIGVCMEIVCPNALSTISAQQIDIFKKCFENYTCEPILHYYDGKQLLSLIPMENKTEKKLKNIASNIIESINSIAPEVTIYIGAGEIKNTVSDFKESIDESIEIIRVMKLFHHNNCIKTFDEMLSHLLVYHLKDHILADKMCHKIFDVLSEYDKTHNCDLIEVLYEYINSNCNISQTTSKLFLHRNTVIYRLKKIEELTDLSLNQPDSIFQFMLAFYLKGIIHPED